MMSTPLAKGSRVPENPAFLTLYLRFILDKKRFELMYAGLFATNILFILDSLYK